MTVWYFRFWVSELHVCATQWGHTLVMCSYLNEIRAREVAQLVENLPRILA